MVEACAARRLPHPGHPSSLIARKGSRNRNFRTTRQWLARHFHLEDFPYRFYDFRAVPFVGTPDFFEHAAICIDQNGQGNRVGAQHVFQE